jgi:hypothetical protein
MRHRFVEEALAEFIAAGRYYNYERVLRNRLLDLTERPPSPKPSPQGEGFNICRVV